MNKTSSGKAIWIVLFFTALGAALIWWKLSTNSAQPGGPAGPAGKSGPQKVTAIIVFPDSIPLQNEFSGNLLAFEEVQLMPEMAGRITRINIREGRQVQKGTLLLSLFDGDLKAQEQKLLLQESIAARNLERANALLQTGSGTRLDADNAENTLNNIRADLEILKANLQKTTITAPFSGKLGFCDLSVGAWVNPGTPVVWLRDTRKLKIEFSVPEKYASQCLPGTKVSFTGGNSGEFATAEIYATDPGYDASTQTLAIRAEVDNSRGIWKPGGFVRVKSSGASIRNALMLPGQCVIPDNKGKKVVLFRNGKAEFREIETGIRNSGRVQVISGIQEGDTVLTSGLMFVKPAAELKLTAIEGGQ